MSSGLENILYDCRQSSGTSVRRNTILRCVMRVCFVLFVLCLCSSVLVYSLGAMRDSARRDEHATSFLRSPQHKATKDSASVAPSPPPQPQPLSSSSASILGSFYHFVPETTESRSSYVKCRFHFWTFPMKQTFLLCSNIFSSLDFGHCCFTSKKYIRGSIALVFIVRTKNRNAKAKNTESNKAFPGTRKKSEY